LDLAALRDDPAFGGAAVRLLPDATLVEFPLDERAGFALGREPNGWRVVLGRTEEPKPLIPEQRDTHLIFPSDAPGRVLIITDPGSGGVLLIGTQLRGGQAVAARYGAPQFVLEPTWQGLVIEPLSDRISLQSVPGGFALVGSGTALAVTGVEAKAGLGQAVGLTHRYHFPTQAVAAVASRLRQQVVAAALAPPLGRGAQQRAVAESLIALGLGAEAEAVLQVAALENPTEAELPDHTGLSAIAALLAERPDQAEAINDTRLSGSDEIALWRAVRLAKLDGHTKEAAAAFAATWPLILTYGAELRERLLPVAAETMIIGGEKSQAAALVSANSSDPRLTLARGMLAQADGETDAALEIYDALAIGQDRLARFRAAVFATELRLAAGRMDKEQAANALEKLLDAWRGDSRDLALRERLAALRADLGHWGDALASLREAARDFPEQQPAIHERMKQSFAAFLSDPRSDAMAPLAFVALVDANADLLPDGPAGDKLQLRLADRLLALDLPRPAGLLLEKLMHTAPTGAGRAGFGARLAAARLRQGDAAGALAALSASAAADLPAALTEDRVLILAEAAARTGDVSGGVSALAALGTPAADEKRAALLERAQNWPAAEEALKTYIGKTVSETGELNETQRRSLLRLAAATARAEDTTGLSALRARETERMGSGPIADMFRLLTADPVRGLADLRRSGQEAVLAHALPEDLKSVR
jgi:hypothetical protein